MLRIILRHEWRLLAADRSLPLIALLLSGLVLYGVVNGAGWTRQQSASIAQAAAGEQARFAAIEAELDAIAGGADPASAFQDPRLPAVVGARRGVRVAALPPGPLAAFAVGHADLQPFHYTVGTNTTEQTLLANGEVDNPHNLHAGRFDLAFVIVYLLPLVILALSFDLLSGERERGTLPLTLAQPVTLRRLLLGKVLMRGLLVLVLTVGVAFVGALLTGVTLAGPGAGGAFLLWSAAVAVYVTFWFGCAVLVNTFGRSSASNATALTGIWLAAVIMVPALISVAATALHPVPSRVDLVGATRAATAEATSERSRILAAYLEEHPELLPPGARPEAASFAAVSYATQQQVQHRLRPVLARYDEQLASQQRIVARYRYLSPAILAHDALTDISGTGTARYRRFQRQVLAHADAMRAFFAPLLFRDARLAPGSTASIPTFQFVEEPARERSTRAGLSILALVVLTLLVSLPGAALLSRQRWLR